MGYKMGYIKLAALVTLIASVGGCAVYYASPNSASENGISVLVNNYTSSEQALAYAEAHCSKYGKTAKEVEPGMQMLAELHYVCLLRENSSLDRDEEVSSTSE